MAINIYTKEDLNNVRNNLDADYILRSNIDIASFSNWVPIGTMNNPFTGRFDGNGFTISNLKINRPTEDNVGLFGVCSAPKSKFATDGHKMSGPVISNLTLENASIVGKDFVGSIVGRFMTDLGEGFDGMGSGNWDYIGSLCEKIKINGNVSGRNKVGGLVGALQGALFAGVGVPNPSTLYSVFEGIVGIKDCSYGGTVFGSADEIGGICGSSVGVQFIECSSSGSVTGVNNIGGITGIVNRVEFSRCGTSNNITASGWLAGGIVGTMEGRGSLKYCSTSGNIKSTGRHNWNYGDGETSFSRANVGTGGIVGYYSEITFIQYSSSLGKIEGERAGGLIGTGVGGSYADPNIIQCFSHGDVQGYTASGSLMGLHYAFGFSDSQVGSGGRVSISEFYSIGNVHGGNAGAVVGHKGPVYDYHLAYPNLPANWEPRWRGEINYYRPAIIANNASTANGGLRKTLDQMSQLSTYKVSWPGYTQDNEINGKYSQWMLNHDVSRYPILRWMQRARTTMLSAVFSHKHGLIVGYSQTKINPNVFSAPPEKKVYYRQKVDANWQIAKEITELSGSSPRIGVFTMKDGRIGFISNKDDKLHMASTNLDDLEIGEYLGTTEMNIEGQYGNMTQTTDASARLIYYIPLAETLARINTIYSGTWQGAQFERPIPVGAGARVSFLRTKGYLGHSIISFRAAGKHHVLFPSIPCGEAPDIPGMPGEKDPKFLFTVEVIDESENPVEGAEVSMQRPFLGTLTLETDENGEVTFEVFMQTHQCTVSKDGYLLIDKETINVSGPNGQKTFTLYAVKGNVTFNVTGEDAAELSGANVSFNSQQKITDASGKAEFLDVSFGEKEYEITHDDFATKTGEINVNDTEHNLDVMLMLPVSLVTFEVSDKNSVPIEGALVEMDNQSEYTDEAGEATIEVRYGEREYVVSLEGYEQANDEILIDEPEKNISVEMEDTPAEEP